MVFVHTGGAEKIVPSCMYTVMEFVATELAL